MPLDQYPWSDLYGWLQDKYGVSWQLSLGSSEEKPQPDVFPSLLFTGEQNGKAEAAINFYTSLFENSKVELIARYQAGEHDTEDHIKFALFTIDGQKLSVMDSSHNHAFNFNPGNSFVVNCDTQEEIDYLWLNLTEGGREDRCGWCQDAFGVSWQIVPTILGQLMSDPQKAPKVVEAFMKMTKFDIQVLTNAAL
jgi:predicted 3-demethylubiquinone-9 3-methyltransferase (glyoxalase superfamily)